MVFLKTLQLRIFQSLIPIYSIRLKETKVILILKREGGKILDIISEPVTSLISDSPVNTTFLIFQF